jgi:eukaryotic-like serine/threonine-protein kinase
MANRIRFGEYELDADVMELRKHGIPLRLQDQPLRVLAFLAARPGEIVTREQLREWIWGDTFVDFDQSLNKAINRAREALQDDRATPQYIETIPRRGYRFIAPITIDPAVEEQALHSETKTNIPAPPKTTRAWKWIATVSILTVVLLATLAMAFSWQRRRKAAVLESPHLVALGWQPTLSQDGKMLTYLANTGGGPLHIWVKQTAGGDAIPVTSGPDADWEPSFSPDGTRIVFVSARNGGGLFITPTLPGEARSLVASPNTAKPLFSPVGDSILFVQQQKAFVVSPDGGQPKPLPLNQKFHVDGTFHWSPDGKEIVFYGARIGDNSGSDDWWIAPLAEGQPRLAHLPGIRGSESAEDAVRDWVRSADDREWILYATSDPDIWHLWRVQVSLQGTVAEKAQLLAEGNAGIAPFGSLTRDGSIAYVVVDSHDSIFQIPLDDRGHKSGPLENLSLHEANKQGAPSLSRNGKWMVYESAAPGKPDSIRIRDLTSSKDRLLDDKGRRPFDYNPTSISPDGSRVLFRGDCNLGPPNGTSSPCVFMAAAAGDQKEQICANCMPRGFSSDGAVLLLEKYEASDNDGVSIVAFDVKSKKEKAFFRASPSHPWLYEPFFSWDDRWVVFKKLQPQNRLPSQLLIAPVRDGLAADESMWIPITDGLQNGDKPQFSADGNTVFYTSTRDGYLCIWEQRLNPLTKRPIGPATAFEHIHSSEGRSGYVTQGLSDLSVAHNKMVINLWQADPGVWMMKVR